MAKRVYVLHAEKPPLASLFTPSTTASAAPELPGIEPCEKQTVLAQPVKAKRGKKKYRLKKVLAADVVERMVAEYGFTIDDFVPVRQKVEGEAAAPKDHAAFWMFWKLYPRHDIVGAALAAWSKLQPDSETVDRILVDIKHRCGGADWQKDGGKWIPFAHTYLRDQRWLDEGVTGAIKRRTIL